MPVLLQVTLQAARQMMATLICSLFFLPGLLQKKHRVCDVRQQDTVGPATHLVAVSGLLSMYGQYGMQSATVEMHCRHHGASITPLRG
uniref:Putative secreted protein n=1 Tax=Ixodes ricinus TaxID=34613 RepID=A0A6B0U5W5_IXORI